MVRPRVVLHPPVTDISLPAVESGTILLLSHELSLTGAPIALLNTARALQRHKKKCLILSPVGGKLEQECKKYGVQCLVYPKLLIHLSRQDAQTQRFFKQFDTVLLNTIVMAKYAKFIKPLVRRVVHKYCILAEWLILFLILLTVFLS